MHIRLGDYKNSEGFGVLKSKYFLQGLTKFDLIDEKKEIWLFSDEPREALSLIPKKYHNRIFVVPDSVKETSLQFELMRNCQNYIISNSTFSWWAAFLSHNKKSQVCVPDRWFKSVSEPFELVPPNWQRVTSYFE